MRKTIKALAIALLAAVGIVATPGVALATGGDLRNSSNDTVYYRYGTGSGTLTSLAPGASAPLSRDVQSVRSAANYTLRYSIVRSDGSVAGPFSSSCGCDIGVVDGQRFTVLNYDRTGASD